MSRPAEAPLFGVDSMVLIYHFEEHETFGTPAGELLQAAEDDRCRLVASVVARLEVLVVPKRHGRHDLCRRYREFFESFPNLEVLPIDDGIVEIASDLRAAHRLRSPDALHLAAALHRGADAFLTEDDRHFPSEAEGVPILSMRAGLARLAS